MLCIKYNVLCTKIQEDLDTAQIETRSLSGQLELSPHEIKKDIYPYPPRCRSGDDLLHHWR